MPDPLLTLETLEPDRPFIEIDGKRYDLAVSEDFGLVEHAKLGKLLRDALSAQTEAEALTEGAFLDEDAVDRLAKILDGTLAMILRAPAEVRERLNSTQKLAVVGAFGEAVPIKAAPTPQIRRPRQRRSTSDNSSPNSRRPSRAKRPGGRCRSVN